MISLILFPLTSIVHADKPNLIVIMTDEHNLRTLGCYRDRMNKAQSFVWGNGVKVETPNIDSLAADGAIFTNFNSVAPLCTPSRASFLTGLYPAFTGANHNHQPLDSTAITFAKVLQKEEGYATGYIGKWHLNGDEKPGFEHETRTFGFGDTKYQFNRGHWKFFEDDKTNGNVRAYDYNDAKKVASNLEEAYATDFLFGKALKFISKRIDVNRHFALMLSIPDPHGPNDVRPPYDTMFNSMKFSLPATGVAAYKKSPANPGWANFNVDHTIADKEITMLENDEKWQTNLRNYFGMVKLIDDKIGELLLFLKNRGLEENTILVFTSDHGDLMGEHARFNKNKPYKTSAGVPFLIRYPKRIKKGKIVRTAYSSPDFAPTILSLMGIDYSDMNFQGIDGSDELLDKRKTNIREQVRFITDSKQAKWAAAVDREYKLVISAGSPYLFDLKKDPDELYNFHDDEKYKDIVGTLEVALFIAMREYKFSVADRQVLLIDRPVCSDTKDQLSSFPNRVCSDLLEKRHQSKCNIDEVSRMCPSACGTCCKDTRGEIRYEGDIITCSDVKGKKDKYCQKGGISKFCPVTCSECIPEPSTSPSSSPSKNPTATPTTSRVPTDVPSTSPSASPSAAPSYSPTIEPSSIPSIRPTMAPSTSPSTSPSTTPSYSPSIKPSSIPSINPTMVPSTVPSTSPSAVPSYSPSTGPTVIPSLSPSFFPSAIPSYSPSTGPTVIPSLSPSFFPSAAPSYIPSIELSSIPSTGPIEAPSTSPSDPSSATPSYSPSVNSTVVPSTSPYASPSVALSHDPTIEPSSIPSIEPTVVPSTSPSTSPSPAPSYSLTIDPSSIQSTGPTELPSTSPSAFPSAASSYSSTIEGSSIPSTGPTEKSPSASSNSPSALSNSPLSSPTISTQSPTVHLVLPTPSSSSKSPSSSSKSPSSAPPISSSPSSDSSASSSNVPSTSQSSNPSAITSKRPSQPSSIPSIEPTVVPSTSPSTSHSPAPSYSLTIDSSLTKSTGPTELPTCGICCKDDAEYTFLLSDSNIFLSRDCAWLKEEDGRVEELCHEKELASSDGRLIKEGCPQTCNSCNTL